MDPGANQGQGRSPPLPITAGLLSIRHAAFKITERPDWPTARLCQIHQSNLLLSINGPQFSWKSRKWQQLPNQQQHQSCNALEVLVAPKEVWINSSIKYLQQASSHACLNG